MLLVYKKIIILKQTFVTTFLFKHERRTAKTVKTKHHFGDKH